MSHRYAAIGAVKSKIGRWALDVHRQPDTKALLTLCQPTHRNCYELNAFHPPISASRSSQIITGISITPAPPLPQSPKPNRRPAPSMESPKGAPSSQPGATPWVPRPDRSHHLDFKDAINTKSRGMDYGTMPMNLGIYTLLAFSIAKTAKPTKVLISDILG